MSYCNNKEYEARRMTNEWDKFDPALGAPMAAKPISEITDEMLLAGIAAWFNSERYPHDLEDFGQRAAACFRAMVEESQKAEKIKYRLVYNKTTKKIDKIRQFDGLAVESFDPPIEE